MASDRVNRQTTAAHLGKFLATFALLSACAPSTSISSFGSGSPEMQRCLDGPAAETRSMVHARGGSEREDSLQNTIERYQKIGIGTWEIFGLPRMLQDLDHVGPGWFYTWSSALPELAIQGWFSGDDVSLEGALGDLHVVLGSSTANAWIVQTAQIEAGRSYDLYVHASGPASAHGGFTVKFMDDAGMLVGERWIPLSGATGPAFLLDLVAPAGAVTAQITGWQSTGQGLALDDIMLVGDQVNVVQNGHFEMSRPFEGTPHDFIPMIWGRDDVTAEDLRRIAEAGLALGFNEPDVEEQANMSVAESVELWPRLVATGARLGSPATSTQNTLGADSWLSRFMAEIERKALRVDFMSVHYYSDSEDVGVFRNFLEQVHAAYGRPIWVTEWGLVDWSDLDRFTFLQTAAFLREGALMMDELDFVERHAWFGAYDGLGGLSMNTNLFYDAGDLTSVGEVFVALASGRGAPGCGPHSQATA